MTPRHAAALALVGWYLIVAPNVPKGPGAPVNYDMNAPRHPDVTAPLYLWWRLHAFHSEAECDKERHRELDRMVRAVDTVRGLEPDAKVRLAARVSLFTKAYSCISDDDPRLNQNQVASPQTMGVSH